VRHQHAATPPRTLREAAEAEGARLRQRLSATADEVLGRQTAGTPPPGVRAGRGVHLRAARVARTLASCPLEEASREAAARNPVPYEDPSRSVLLSIDDVGAKRQKAHRIAGQGRPDGEPKRVQTTVAHIESRAGQYLISGHSAAWVLRLVVAFLVQNRLLGGNLIVFADGQKTLHASVRLALGWVTGMRIILDWYHLQKKCAEQLSLGLRGRAIRNQVLAEVMGKLWYGLVEEAIALLRGLDRKQIKDAEVINALIARLERDREIIPCYAVRKALGLRNSSNRGEKANDLVVSDRQKHNGMSWSPPGSGALAQLSTLARNGEHQEWFESGRIGFRLVA
jgi:hypothetical protein